MKNSNNVIHLNHYWTSPYRGCLKKFVHIFYFWVFVNQASNAKMLLKEAISFAKSRKCLEKAGYPFKNHQVDGVKWMIHNELTKKYKGGLICDDPGLGKTIQTMGIMAANPVRLTLIILPTSVLNQWIKIVNDVFGKDKSYVHYSNTRAKTRAELLLRLSNATVAITSYALISDPLDKNNTHTILHSIKWDRVVIDEGHQIRNAKTLSHRMACDLHTTYRWVLTGTPIQNKRQDIINLFKFLGISPSISRKNIDMYIDGYLLRRNKTLLFDENFSDYEIINHNCEFKTKEEQTIYKTIQDDSVKEFMDRSEDTETNTQILMLEILLRLRQASVHPRIAINSLKRKFSDETLTDKSVFNGISTKMQACIDEINKSSGLSLVFSHFREEMELMQKYLEKKGIKSEIYDGTLNLNKRQSILDKYKKENAKKSFKIIDGRIVRKPFEQPTVLLIQIKAGGVGLNLQQFSNIFIMSPDWNPCNEIQAIARAHRIGQKDKVKVHKFTLVTNQEFDETDDKKKQMTTIDQRILTKQVGKYKLMQNMLNDDTLVFRDKMIGNGRLAKTFGMQDLEYLLLGK